MKDNRLEEINTENRTCYYLDDLINKKRSCFEKITLDEIHMKIFL